MTTWVENLLAKARAAEGHYVNVGAADPPTVQRLCGLVLEAERLLDFGPPTLTTWHEDRRAWLARLREG